MTDALKERRKALRIAAEKPQVERRVYELSSDLCERILRFQASQRLPNEVSAARYLIDAGLKARGF